MFSYPCQIQYTNLMRYSQFTKLQSKHHTFLCQHNNQVELFELLSLRMKMFISFQLKWMSYYLIMRAMQV